MKHIDRITGIIDDYRRQFQLKATKNVVISRALDVARQEHLDERYAWLFAAMGLAEENEALRECAQVRMATAPSVVTSAVTPFTYEDAK